MKADENYVMCKHLESDFAANSLLFVGCSLTDELDLLFAAENGLEAKANLNKDEAKIVFIRYCGGDLAIPFEERLKYENTKFSSYIYNYYTANFNDYNCICAKPSANITITNII